jgi:hypothetical protein
MYAARGFHRLLRGLSPPGGRLCGQLAVSESARAAGADVRPQENARCRIQADRHRADYDLSWNIVGTDAENAVTAAEETFTKWRSHCTEEVARQYLLSLFGANR